MAVARFIDHRTFTLRDGQSAALQQWLTANEKALAASFPAGAQWLGAYAEVYGGETDSGWHVLFGLDSYAALDRTSAAGGDPGSEFGRLIGELLSFFDLSSSGHGGSSLYRAAPSVVVWENE